MSKPISKFPQLPCIKKKCIVYPVCRNRMIIECEELVNYRAHLNMRYELYPIKSIWFKINKVLPNLEVILFHELVVDHKGKESFVPSQHCRGE